MVERSDAYILTRLVDRVRLLVAVSEEIPIETKLQTQGVLKLFEAEVTRPEDEQDWQQVRGYYAMLYGDLEPYPDLEALLSAMKNFVSYL